MTALQTAPAAATVSEADQFLFDVQGYLLLRGALAEQDRVDLLAEIERLEAREFDDSTWMKSECAKKGSPTRQVIEDGAYIRLNGLLRLSDKFDRLIDYPAVIPYLRAFMQGPQLVNTWCITKFHGGDYGGWHRGVPPEQYTVRVGKINSRMLNTVWFLTDNGPDDGGLAVIPGAHKSQFDLKWGQYKGDTLPGSVRVTGKAGDVLVFSEAVMHTGLAKTTPGRRTNLYFNYTTRDFNVCTYSPEHNHHFVMPESVRSRFTEDRRTLTDWMKFVVSDG